MLPSRQLKEPPQERQRFHLGPAQVVAGPSPGVYISKSSPKRMSRGARIEELAQIGEAASPDDVLVIFLSGHGVQYQGKAPDGAIQPPLPDR